MEEHSTAVLDQEGFAAQYPELALAVGDMVVTAHSAWPGQEQVRCWYAVLP